MSDENLSPDVAKFVAEQEAMREDTQQIRPISAPPALDFGPIAEPVRKDGPVRADDPDGEEYQEVPVENREIYPDGHEYVFDIRNVPVQSLYGRINVYVATKGGEITTLNGALVHISRLNTLRLRMNQIVNQVSGFNTGVFEFLMDDSENPGAHGRDTGSAVVLIKEEMVIGYEIDMCVWHPHESVPQLKLLPYAR